MEIRIPLSVTNVAFLIAGLAIGYSCSANADDEIVRIGGTTVHIPRKAPRAVLQTPIKGSSDPCLANIEKLCAEIDTLTIHNSFLNDAEKSAVVEAHNKNFNN